MKQLYQIKIKPWSIALLAAVIPLIATHLAWWLSMKSSYIPVCIPYFEGCTSISRAARNGFPNTMFKMLMLPSAFFQCLVWFAWKPRLQKINSRFGRSLPFIGATVFGFLSLYVIFLGTDGAIYQLLRRYGITIYFGATYLGQLIVHYRLGNYSKDFWFRSMQAITTIMLPLALLGLYFSITTMDVVLNDEIENIVEWNLTLLMILWFIQLSFFWKKSIN